MYHVGGHSSRLSPQDSVRDKNSISQRVAEFRPYQGSANERTLSSDHKNLGGPDV
jgi:hypothetical protein